MRGGRSLRRLWRHRPWVVVASAILLASGLGVVGATLASFTADTQSRTSTFAAGWVGSASGLTATPSGYDASLAWTPATHGLDGQQLYFKDNGASSSCSTTGFSTLGSGLSATANSYTQSNGTSGSLNGHYGCYRVDSTRSGTSWTATATFTPGTQLGLVATSIALANGGGGTSGKINNGDTITVVFNQAPTAITTGTGRSVCLVDTVTPAVIVLGDTAGCTGSGDANDTGTISGLTMSGGGAMGANAIVNCNNSTFSISSSTLTITVGSVNAMGGAGVCATTSGTLVNASGSGTYNPASTILSAALTDQASICTNVTYSCKPTTSGSF